MSMVVRIRSQRTMLEEQIGQGAMADIHLVHVGGIELVGKIYRYDDPSKEMMRPIRAKKIPKMCTMNLPPECYPPLDVITSDQGEFLGFTMERFPPGYLPLGELYAPSFWGVQFITPSKVLKIMQSLHRFIKKVHASNLVIVDLNPGNAQFHLGTATVIGCDVDSYQIPGFNGMECHPDYASLRVINIDLAQGDFKFEPDDDWWSFYIHFVTGLTRGGHPFRGKGDYFKQQKKQYVSVADRAMAGVSIFDPKVEPAGQALPIEIMPDNVLQHLSDVLVNRKKADGPMPEWMFDMKFQKCPACGEEHARTKCPYCTKIVFIPSAVVLAKLVRENIYTSKWPIVAIKVIQDQIVLVFRFPDAFEVAIIDLHTGEEMQRRRFRLLLDPTKNYVIKIGDDLIGIADQENLYIYDFKGNLLEQTTTTRFFGRPMFALGDKLYRGVGASIMVWDEVQGRRVYKPVTKVTPGSTWFEATEAGLVYMIYANGQYEWTLMQGNTRKRIEAQKIFGKRVLDQFAVSDGIEAIAIIRIVEDTKGVITSIIDVLNVASGDTNHYSYEEPIRDPVFANGKILFANDDGLMRWELGKDPVAIPETENVIVNNDVIKLPDPQTIVIQKQFTVDVLRASKR